LCVLLDDFGRRQDGAGDEFGGCGGGGVNEWLWEEVAAAIGRFGIVFFED
jgi:hypothetical protein